ncbi:MAG: DNA-protecting protein DprA, partial [Ignavibacteriales bacterium]
MNDWNSWLALGKAPGLGPRRFLRLVETYGSPKSVFDRGPREIARILQVPVDVASGILRRVPGPEEDRECKAIADAGCRLITLASDEYPPLLKTIHDPPPFLYARGRRL